MIWGKNPANTQTCMHLRESAYISRSVLIIQVAMHATSTLLCSCGVLPMFIERTCPIFHNPQ